jgi:type 1 fimbria pilin
MSNKIGRIVPLLACAIGVYCSAAAAKTEIKLHGALVAEPCVIKPGDENIQLDFGSVVEKYLYLNGRTPSQPFTLRLSDCDLGLGKAVKITFSGIENAALPGLLALDATSSARGVAIGLETAAGTAAPLNKTLPALPLATGDTLIAMRAFIQGEPQALSNNSITQGEFTATVNFTLGYE